MATMTLLHLVERIGTLMRAESRRTAATLKLQPVHLQVLAYLARCNRYSNTLVAVSSYLGITKGSASQSLLVLERKGLLNKVPDSKDRRVLHLHLTTLGQDAVSSTFQSMLWQQAASGLEEAQLARAAQTLDRILRNTQHRCQSQTFGHCFTCRHFQTEAMGRFRCRLTREAVSAPESAQICYQHEFPQLPVS